MEEKNKFSEDTFWDNDIMLPPKKTTSSFSRDTDTVIISVDPDLSDDKTVTIPPKRGAIPKKDAPKPESAKKYSAEPITVYTPENPLIKKVSIWRWPSKYTFYERFRSDAIKLFYQTGNECSYEQFFSYMPQYVQLNHLQSDYYIWWRDNLRNKIYLKADYGYIYLYVYEIINLPDFITPAKGLELLCDIWLAYRDEFPKLDRYMIEWICDFCLINMMEAPIKRLEPLLGKMLETASFKEFYFSSDNENSYACSLLNFASNYNWRTSKFYTGENTEIFDKHMQNAFVFAITKISAFDNRFKFEENDLTKTKITRDAYSGSLCAYNIKRRIDIEYNSCTRSPELKMIITDIVKLIENNIRSMLGIKNRFSTVMLTPEMKTAVNEYFEPLRSKKKSRSDENPEYMSQYDIEDRGLSTESALSIERNSWIVTEKLTESLFSNETDEAFASDETDIETEADDEITNKNSTAADNKSSSANGDIIREALVILLDCDNNAFIHWADSHNLLADTALELVNEAMYDVFGDIAAECGPDGAYKIIDDYIDDVKRYINS